MNVEVSIGGGTPVRANRAFLFYMFDTTAASPSIGPETGGTLVQVHGTPNVDYYTPYCRFGDRVSRVLVVGERDVMGTVICKSPAYSGLNLTSCEDHYSSTLEITFNGQQYSPLEDFVYYSRDAPCLQSVYPASGPVDGGTNISITLDAPSLRTFPSSIELHLVLVCYPWFGTLRS